MTTPQGTPPNLEMATFWNEQAGPRWVKLQPRMDRAIREIGLHAIDAGSPAPGESVLDLGCGAGDTCLELARRVGETGQVVGLDISAPLLERARERVAEAGLSHVDLQRGDVQVHELPPAAFDLAFSRFGVMFFEDPRAAFANVLSALRPGGRLAFCCWREREANPWMTTLTAAAAPHVDLPAPPEDPHAPGPFALADASRIRRLLEGSGFASVATDALDVLLALAGGGPLDETVEHALEMGPLATALAEASDDVRERVRRAVREALAPHATPEGVRLPGAAWIVTARKPASG